LRAADAAWRRGVADAAGLHQALHQVLDSEAGVPMDYVAIVDPEGLQPVNHAEPGVIVALAARVGKTRLIDNLILGQPG
jgi:pantothenate synthetase